jgi:O-antigen/teichoic acid export membrane protein
VTVPDVPDVPDVLDTPDAGPAAIRGGALRVGGYAVGLVLSLLGAALLFRHLGVDDTGRYVTVFAIVTVVQGLTEAGLTTIGVREASTRTGEARSEFIRDLLGMRFVLTTIGVVLATLFALAAGYEQAMVIGTIVVGAAVVVQNQQQTLGVSLMARLKMGWVAAADLVRQAASALAIIALVIAGASLLPFFSAPLVGALLSIALTAWLVRRDVPLIPAFRLKTGLALLRETAPFALASAAAVLYFRIGVILMSLLATASQVGYFGASFRVVEVLSQVPTLAVTAMFPIVARAARDDEDRLAYAVQRTFEGGLLAGAALSLAVGVAAPFAIQVVAGDGFAPAADVLRIQSASLVVSFVGLAWALGLLSLHRHRALLVVNLVALGVTSVLVALLASKGAETVAWVALGGDVLLASSTGIALARARRSLRPDLRRLLPVGLAAGAGVGVALLLHVHSAVEAAVAVGVYFAICLPLRAVPAELIAEVRGVLRRGRPT